MAYSKKKHLQDNILAIQTVFRLKNENREATADEKEILGRYSGFGGLKCILRPCESPEDKNKWPASEQGQFEDTKLLYSIIRQHSGSDAAYKDYCNSLRSSILTAFYTPDQVTQAIATGLYDSGIEVKNILEPSAGIGSFVKAFNDLGNYAVTCFEKDLLTAEILSRLYPHDLVLGKGFETIDERSLGYFDIVSSNIPFGDYRVYDPLFSGSKDEDKKRSCKDIHSYFFIKAVDAAREGGIIAFITSQGVMNSPKNDYLRKWLMDRCNLVSAVRLPDNLFIDSANTEAPSDLIILQKNSSKTEQTIREYSFTGIRKLGEVNINNYYMDFSRVVHTAVSLGKNQYGDPAINFLYEGDMDELSADLYNKIREDCAVHLDLDLYNTYLKTEIPSAKEEYIIEDNAVEEELTPTKEFSLYDLFGIPEEERTQIGQKQKTKAGVQSLQKTSVSISLTDITDNAVEIRTQSLEPRLYEGILMDFYKDGVLVENEGQVGILSIKTKWNQKKQCEDKEYLFTPLKINKDLTGRLLAYINLREAYFHLHQTESVEHRVRPELRETLNNRYLEFTTRYGDLNNKDNHKLMQQDIFGDEILTLEYYENGKKQMAGIFFHPVAFMTDKTILVEKADEALASSINKFGVVNLDYMSGISGKDNNVLIEELEGIIYYNPLSGEYEIASCFISGDVIVKSEEIEAYINDNPEADDIEWSRKSLEILRKAIPEPIPFSDLDFNFGERWLPVTYYNEYVSRIFNTKITIEYIADIDNFHIAAESEYTVEIREKYAVKPEYRNDVSGLTILSHALVNTFPKITKPSGRYNANGQEIRIPDLDAIQQANIKIDEIRSGFTDYLNDLPIEAKGELADLYNRKFNARVKPKYDGKFQTFPDLQLQALGIDKPYESQFDTVWMLKSNGGGIVDHEVGAGKTLTICITAHEMKRLKMAHKLCLYDWINLLLRNSNNDRIFNRQIAEIKYNSR